MLSKEDISTLPDKPGVYLFKNKSSEIIYIGKAKSLKKRVRSYTYKSYRHSKRTRQMIRRIKEVSHILCGSELEALLLESRLIKENLPEYNIMQRKLRNYPFVKITMREDFPRIMVVWEIESDGAKYMGPFQRWYDAEEAVEIMQKFFPLRQCGDEVFSRAQKVCLNYHIGKCLGPCAGAVTKAEYRKMVGSIIRLLGGRYDRLIKDMEGEMKEAAAKLNFERAARLRDQIGGIREFIFRRQFRVNSVDNNNLIAIYPSGEANSVEMFFIKKGALVNQRKVAFPCKTDNGFLESTMRDIENIFFNGQERGKGPAGKFEVDAMNIISKWLYRHRNDQSLVYIRKKHSKVETIAFAAKEVKRVIESLISI